MNITGASTTPSINIAIIANGFPVLSETFIYLQLIALAEQDHRVTVYNLGGSDPVASDYQNRLGRFNSVKINHIGVAPEKNRPHHLRAISQALTLSFRDPAKVLPALLKTMWNHGIYNALRLATDAFFLKNLKQYDIVHCQFLTIAQRLAELKKYDLIPHCPPLVSSVRGYDITKSHHLKKMDLTNIFVQFSGFFPACKFLENILIEKNCKRPISIVHSPASMPRSKAFSTKSIQKKQVNFLSIGRLVDKKGFELSLQALSQIDNGNHKFTYTIIGSGDEEKRLKNLTQQLNLQNSVSFKGILSHEETLDFLHSSDILLVPSKTGENGDSEGIPNVIKEAMLSGVVVIASDHAGIPELVKDNQTGFLFSENKVEELVNTLKRSIANHKDWARITASAHEYTVSQFSIEKTTEQLLDAYRQHLHAVQVKT